MVSSYYRTDVIDNEKTNKRTIQLVSGAVATALLARAAYRQNHQLDISSFVYHNEKLPGSFHGFRILQVSDLHNARFGFHQKKLMKEIQLASPDIILISGDLIDKRRCRKNNIQPALRFVRKQSRLLLYIMYQAIMKPQVKSIHI